MKFIGEREEARFKLIIPETDWARLQTLNLAWREVDLPSAGLSSNLSLPQFSIHYILTVPQNQMAWIN